MHTLQMSKTRSQTSEEFCKAFLDQHVRPLWPKGWMQTRMLYKESKPAHSLWTNPYTLPSLFCPQKTVPHKLHSEYSKTYENWTQSEHKIRFIISTYIDNVYIIYQLYPKFDHRRMLIILLFRPWTITVNSQLSISRSCGNYFLQVQITRNAN